MLACGLTPMSEKLKKYMENLQHRAGRRRHLIKYPSWMKSYHLIIILTIIVLVFGRILKALESILGISEKLTT